MKKIFLIAAVTAVALSSCSKNEVKVNPSDPTNAIGFGSYLGTNTKAEVEDEFVVGDKMSVMTYATGKLAFNAATSITPFMTNEVVTKDGADDWSYTNTKYWPKDDAELLSFFAVSDASATTREFKALNADDKANFNYTNPSKAADQVDLMAASELNLTNSGSTEVTNGKVKFTFKHILSQIKFNFSAKENYTGAAINVTNVTVTYGDDFCAQGNFAFDEATESVGVWTPNGAGTKQAPESFNTSTQAALTKAGAADLGIVPIMVIPQNQPLNVTVNYTVTQGSVVFEESFTTTTSLTPATDGFVQNTVYTYPVTISLNEIIFGEPAIDTNSWVPTGGSNIAIPTV